MAKLKANQHGITLSELIEKHLQLAILGLNQGKLKRDAFNFPTLKGHRLPKIDISDRDALIDAMEKRR